MPKYSIKVAGSSKLKNQLKQLPEDLRAGLKLAVKASAAAIKADAKKRAPVESGNLKKSIRYRVDPDGLGATVRVDEFYGRFVEYGTTSQDPQPFMTPAAEAERTRFPGRISDDVRKAIGLR